MITRGDIWVPTRDADMVAGDLAVGKVGYAKGKKVTGTRGLDAYTVALLHFDGTDEGTTITDETGKTWTAVGTANTETSQKVYGTASLELDGDSDYIYTADSEDFNFGADPFTIDFWHCPTDVSTVAGAFYSQGDDANNRFYIYHGDADVYFYLVTSGSVTANYHSTGSLSLNVWKHIAVVRNGTSIYIFINGVSQSLTVTTAISTTAIGNYSLAPTIGVRKYAGTEDRYLPGYLDEFRISKGIARWTANFVPGSPYGG